MHQWFARNIRDDRKVKDVRTLGTILAIEVRDDHATSYENPMRKRIYKFFLDRNILLRPLGNVLYVLPPYVIRLEELATVHDAIVEFLDDL